MMNCVTKEMVDIGRGGVVDVLFLCSEFTMSAFKPAAIKMDAVINTSANVMDSAVAIFP